jgi:hypothetical protein
MQLGQNLGLVVAGGGLTIPTVAACGLWESWQSEAGRS